MLPIFARVYIYGHIGIAGVTISYTDFTAKSVVSDSRGNFLINVPSGWSGTLVFSHGIPDMEFNNILLNQTLFAIYGNVGIAGATLTYGEQAVEADADGNYIIIVAAGWSGTVTPSKTDYEFTPTSRDYTNLAVSDGGEDYTAEAVGAIYGVSWTKVESPTLTRTDDAVGMTAEAGVGSETVTNDFDTAEIYKDIEQVTDDDGNVFIRIPKFYIEKTSEANFASWRISTVSFGDAYLPKCFVNPAGGEYEYVDVGAYNASLDSGGTKLESKADTYPLVNKNIVEFRDYAEANGAGYYQLDVHVYDLLQVLFFVEFATLNAQSIMYGFANGRFATEDVATAAENGANRIVVATATAALYEVGQTISIGTSLGGNQIFYGRQITGKTVVDASNTAIEFDGAAVNIAIGNILYNTGQKSGWSAGLAAKSGSLYSNSSGKFSCAYRGIENPWGSVWQFVDGVNINDNQAWVCDTPADYVSNLFASPYKQLSYVNLNAYGYAVEMGLDPDNPSAQFPTSVTGGAATKFYCDFYYPGTGQTIAFVGGRWNNGSYAGPSSWNLTASAPLAVTFTLGGRLIKGGA
jgi:hypothetical protein